MLNPLECKDNRNVSRNPFYKLQMLGFLRFLTQELTFSLHSHFFLSFFSSKLSQLLSIFRMLKSKEEAPFFSLSSPHLNPHSTPLWRQNPLTHSSRCTLARFPSTLSPTIDFACGNGLVEVWVGANSYGGLEMGIGLRMDIGLGMGLGLWMGLGLEWLISKDIFGSSCIPRSLTFSSLGFRCGPQTEGAYRCPLDFSKNRKYAFKFFKKSTCN